MSEIISNDYHDFVIKDGKFVGEFEQMYSQCDNPWPESIEEIRMNPFSRLTIDWAKDLGVKSMLSVGGGKGKYLNYLQENLPGCGMSMIELSQSACEDCRRSYPSIHVIEGDSLEQLSALNFQPDLIIFREIIWYILPNLGKVISALRERFAGSYIITELSFYQKQEYGNEYIDGVNDFLEKYPFELKDLLLRNNQPSLNYGYLFTLGRINNDK